MKKRPTTRQTVIGLLTGAAALGAAVSATPTHAQAADMSPEQTLETINANPKLYSGSVKAQGDVRVYSGEGMSVDDYNNTIAHPSLSTPISKSNEIPGLSSFAWHPKQGGCKVFFNQKADDTAYKQLGKHLPADASEDWKKQVTPTEIAAFTALHEFRHCAQGKAAGGRVTVEQFNVAVMMAEADADAHAIRALEAKNPQTRIRDYAYSMRIANGSYGNALALKYMLENKQMPANLADFLNAGEHHKEYSKQVTDWVMGSHASLPDDDAAALPIAKHIANMRIAADSGNYPMMRDWAQMQVDHVNFTQSPLAKTAKYASENPDLPYANTAKGAVQGAVKSGIAVALN